MTDDYVRAKIEDALYLRRDEFQQNRLAFGAMGDAIRPRQVFQGVFGGGVFVKIGRASHINFEVCRSGPKARVFNFSPTVGLDRFQKYAQMPP